MFHCRQHVCDDTQSTARSRTIGEESSEGVTLKSVTVRLQQFSHMKESNCEMSSKQNAIRMPINVNKTVEEYMLAIHRLKYFCTIFPP